MKRIVHTALALGASLGVAALATPAQAQFGQGQGTGNAVFDQLLQQMLQGQGGQQQQQPSAWDRRCDVIAGEWRWFDGSRLMADPSGRFATDRGREGRIYCVDPNRQAFEFRWDAGWRDQVTLSRDLSRLDGVNDSGQRITAERTDRRPPPGGGPVAGGPDGGPDGDIPRRCQPAVGTWTWFDGNQVTLQPNGRFRSTSGNRGRWSCTDPGDREITLNWDPGWVDTLRVDREGTRLEGRNTQGFRVTADRADDDRGDDTARLDPGCESLLGTFGWRGGASISLYEDASFRIQGARGPDRGNWNCQVDRRRVTLRFDDGAVETLRFSRDRQTLTGAIGGRNVTATR
ncbi:hypothetical protein [Zavarzinia sp. CC-PAN008]|uniref:hypothetical protein n=1 Tax=Zavarzinia sp. CC-PAN008 TaxID=3243332 RepID=UPI003F749C92